ncbi:potassium channel [Ophiostoma piceae UAMH 11346]|uniref:Potassium channel n=1 Tax=Ophiostoma piceae (strain UAMH 11346) TaxID=1262450 RepID=S3BRG1_OPHP1|nr:potassium channel [Ophiostoma piceae UAMH 11346]
MDGTDRLPEDAVEVFDDSRPQQLQQDPNKENNGSNAKDENGGNGEPAGFAARRTSVNAAGYPNFLDDDELMPSRWWFAASAFPMAAGTLGPVASAFSICALVRPWRQVIKPGEEIDTASFIKDPIWLTAVNAIQLFIALVANMFLLLNMARRIRFVIAQPVTMIGWYFSSLTLIALTSTAAGPLKESSKIGPDSTMVWSQAFYYAVYSAVLYMLVASLMVVTFVGASKGHYPKDFQLSNSQRTLMLQTIMFLMYLLIGALVFSNLEGWAYLDAVYWADVTLFTVGFGDFAAETTAGRALLFPYALVGIISLGLVIGSIRSLALERGRRRLNARMTEKNRRRVLLSLAKKGKDEILQPIQSNTQTNSYSDNNSLRNSMRHSLRTSFNRSRPHTATGLTEFERREKEFNIMRKIQHDAANKRRWVAMATSSGLWVALWLIGAWVFQACEHPYQNWDYFDGFYLSFVSLTTIGYGDMTPVSNAGRSFFVFWSLLALPATTILISNAGDTIVKAISDATNAVGRITILPGERGLKKDLKLTIRALTCGVVFDDIDIEEAPPGLLGAAQQTEGEREESIEDDEEQDEEEAEEVVNEAEMEIEREKNYGHDDNDDDEDNGNDGDYDHDGNRTVSDAYSTRDEYMLEDGPRMGPSTRTNSNTTGKEYAEGSSASTTTSRKTLGGKTRSSGQLYSSRRSSARAASKSKSSRSGSSTPLTKSKGASSSRPGQPGYALGAISAVSLPRTDFPQDLPHTRPEYHCVLIDEIARVTEHLRHSPPRKYTFQEWAWYLRLIGEDEHNADHHRKVKVTPAPRDRRRHKLGKRGSQNDVSSGDATDAIDEQTSGVDSADAPGATRTSTTTGPSGQWSWVGARSPLMGSQEEGEWILDKLTKRLQAELALTKDADDAARGGDYTDTPCHAENDQTDQNKTSNSSGCEAVDLRPYSSGHLNRRETHPIEEEP